MINQEKIKSINTFLEKYGLKKAWANVLVKKISNSGTKYKYIYNYYSCTNSKKIHAKRLYINEEELFKPKYTGLYAR